MSNSATAQKEPINDKEQELATLGDGKVFVKRTHDGVIKAVRGFIKLEESNSEIAAISGKVMTTSKGFYKANQIAGISIVTPEKLQLPEGQLSGNALANTMVVNPFPIIDEESGSITKVWVKKTGIGYSPTGNLVVTSATLLYDIKMYFIQDVLKKVRDNQGAGRVCLESSLSDEEKKKGQFLKIDGSMGVWIDFSQKDILKALDTFVNKKLFAERNAQSICERLVMGKHPALAHLTYVSATGPDRHLVAKVPVIGYVHDFSKEQLLDISTQAERGEEIKINGKKVETIQVTTTATAEEMTVEADDEEVISQASAPVNGVSEESAPSLFGGDRY